MADAFERLIAPLIGREGGYVNHPSDKGGETIWGITVAVARQNGFTGSMRTMTRDQAIAIYRARYWSGPSYDRIALISEKVAEELFDTGVNMGPAVASMFLQRALNALNRKARDFPDLKVDGEAGEKTRQALAALYRFRGADGELVLLRALNALQGERYIALSEGRPANEDFTFGWFRTRVA